MSTGSNTFGKLGVLRIVSLSFAGLMFFGASFTWADGLHSVTKRNRHRQSSWVALAVIQW